MPLVFCCLWLDQGADRVGHAELGIDMASVPIGSWWTRNATEARIETRERRIEKIEKIGGQRGRCRVEKRVGEVEDELWWVNDRGEATVWYAYR